MMQAENLSVAAAFNLSYRDLTAGQRRLFRRLGLHPGPDIDAHAAAALCGTGLTVTRRHLQALYGQHLITEPAAGRYRLHDLLREHARALAAADDAGVRDAASGRLLDYYLHAALAANEKLRLTMMPAIGKLPAARPPDCAPRISTPEQAATWFEAERANLDAAAVHAAACGWAGHATLIPAAMDGFLYLRGYWSHALALQQTALDAARQAGDQLGQARALALLGSMQGVISDFAAAAATLRQALALYRDLGDRAGEGDVLSGQGYLHSVAGDYPAMRACHQQALALFRDLDDPAGQAHALNALGVVYWATGNYPAAAASAGQALDLFRAIGHQSGQATALHTLAIVHKLTGDYPAAAASLEQALATFGGLGDRYMQAGVHLELGAVQRLTGNYAAATASSWQALQEFGDLGEPAGRAGALNELGLVQQLTGDYPAASASHQQALSLLVDLGSRDDLADVLNSLGELAHRTAASQQALDHHNQALAIARDLATPLQEARALEGIGPCDLQDGHAPRRRRRPARGADHLPAHRITRRQPRPANPRPVRQKEPDL
jgi:tetratricopeptide (TPR) repeat protein